MMTEQNKSFEYFALNCGTWNTHFSLFPDIPKGKQVIHLWIEYLADS